MSIAGVDQPNFDQLETYLNRDPSLVIPKEALELVGGKQAFLASLPTDPHFVVKPGSWAPDGTGGTVGVTVKSSQGNERVSAVMLEDQHHRWFLVQTFPLNH